MKDYRGTLALGLTENANHSPFIRRSSRGEEFQLDTP